ncbi:hypothetical protein [Phosphitispora fastidiosa]|uniref:hypothetical protein n=1 Tax=Phosphitispora fastidiosa TaxID=2837202 RepID=UPI001E4CA172|nr:hypothetical protein [Phosphitispora fastidiosa]MBU7005775.1 hypothetical protein [Phosphitispora fastidiosa]
MENSEGSWSKLNLEDGVAIKRALFDYFAGAEGDIFSLRDTINGMEPEIDSVGVLRIGPWVYNAENRAMAYFLAPGEAVGYDYQAFLDRDGEVWKISGVRRIEVFMR